MELMNRSLITRWTVSRYKARHPGGEWDVEGEFVGVSWRCIVLEEIEWDVISGVGPVPQLTGRLVYIPLRLRPEMANALIAQDVRTGDLIRVFPAAERRYVIANLSSRPTPKITTEVEITRQDGEPL